MTRQAFYKKGWEIEQRSMANAIILKIVNEIRVKMPRIGARKLHYLIQEPLKGHKIEIGRDKLFDLLSEHGLLVRRRKRYARTTDSNHRFRKYTNLIKELDVVRPDQLWVSDITYLTLKEGFCYLSLVTDAYSRRIVGYYLSKGLEADGCIRALLMAIAARKNPDLPLIHHSDRGIQYCCNDYIRMLNSNEMGISMAQKGDPYENAIAERINGILKTEFNLAAVFDEFEQASAAVNQSIMVYNEVRPHGSCDYLTPNQAHEKHGLLSHRWKNYNKFRLQTTNALLTY